MYYPLQIPYIFDKDFARCVNYTEEIITPIKDFLICLWTMQPRINEQSRANNVIVCDGGIDLVVLLEERQIGFAGFSKTKFDDPHITGNSYFGARFKPGAFAQLTGLPAEKAMDKWLPLSAFDPDFDEESFFNLPFDEAKSFFQDYLIQIVDTKEPNDFVLLFDQLSENPPATAGELYSFLHFSPRQCQRLFAKHFALTPQRVLSVIRFQYCLQILTSKQATPAEILDLTTYYDQSHFIKDFKKNIGLTPFELLAKYEKSHFYNTKS